ncbi:hypothetical protein HGB13_00085 [bacterium]|nr:hypothetical protein [bacterium]
MGKFKVGDRVKITDDCLWTLKPGYLQNDLIVSKVGGDQIELNGCTGFWWENTKSVIKLEQPQPPTPKFKIGDMVTGTGILTYLYNQTGEIIDIIYDYYGHEDGYKVHVKGHDLDICWKSSELKLVEPATETIPLKNTIITDIKSEEQHKRVQKKLFEMGCEWREKKKNIKNDALCDEAISINKTGDMLATGISCCRATNEDYFSAFPFYEHITASEFLGEVPVKTEEEEACDTLSDLVERVCVGGGGPVYNWDEKNSPSRWFMSIGDGEPNNNKLTNNKTNNKTMSNITNFINDLSVSQEDKDLRKAGLKDSNLRWTTTAQNIVKDMEAQVRGFKNWTELCNQVGLEDAISSLELESMFQAFGEKLLLNARKFNKANKEDK